MLADRHLRMCVDGAAVPGKAVPAGKGGRPAYTAERRRNLSEAIKAKWQDPEYRSKILAALRNPAYQDRRVASQRVRSPGRRKSYRELSPCRSQHGDTAQRRARTRCEVGLHAMCCNCEVVFVSQGSRAC